MLAAEDPTRWLSYPGGLYTYWFDTLYAGVDTFIDTAQLYDGVEELFGIKTDAPPANTSKRMTPDYLEPSSLYTPELIELVREHDGPLAERLGFAPFSPSTKGAVIRL